MRRRASVVVCDDSSEVLATGKGVGGSLGDADHNGVDHDHRAMMVVPQFEENEFSTETLELEIAAALGFSG